MTTKAGSGGKLEGKIALVTGGNSGIGLASAEAFAREGARVFITGRREIELAKAVRAIGGNVTAIRGDVSKLADLDQLMTEVQTKAGRIDILFANAGVMRASSLGDITEDVYDSVFGVNVKGMLFTVQKALPLMANGGSIVLNASIAANKGIPANTVYGASKAAVRSFARTWASELKNRKIRVNAISPGCTDTPGAREQTESSPTSGQRRAMLEQFIPLGRFASAEEIAQAVVFLASDDSSYVNGTELIVDGGLTQV